MDLIAAAANAAEPAAPRSTKGTTDEKILQLRNSFYLCGQAQENAAWRNYKDKKTDEVKKLVSPELVAVYATGASNLQSELETMAKWDMKTFTLSNYQVAMSDAETAVCTYQVKLDGTLGGTDMSGMHNCATIWQCKNGDWRAIFHTDIKAMSSPAQ